MREKKIIRLWFDMWLKQQDLGIDKIFTEDVVYTESWCPKYENLKTVKHWFNEWNILVVKSLFGILNSSFIKKIQILQRFPYSFHFKNTILRQFDFLYERTV